MDFLISVTRKRHVSEWQHVRLLASCTLHDFTKTTNAEQATNVRSSKSEMTDRPVRVVKGNKVHDSNVSFHKDESGMKFLA